MPTFVTPFTTPANYTYDSDKIKVLGGLAILGEDLAGIVHARYHMDQSSGLLVPDDSGNGRDGTAVNIEDGDWVTGKIGNALQLDGVNEHVNCGLIAAWDYLEAFSVECWFKTTATAIGALASKMVSTVNFRGWLVAISGGTINVLLRNTATKYLSVLAGAGLNNNVWHHLVTTYSGLTGTSSDLKVYLDNVDTSLNVVNDNLTATILNDANCCLGCQNQIEKFFAGSVDEVALYDRVVTADEVSYRWNSGAGRDRFPSWRTDSPTIYKTAGDTDPLLWEYAAFVETLGPESTGTVAYQLSDNGSTWRYWNGSSWAVAGASDYNSADEVNTNISTFPTASDSIWVKSFLISDGTQPVDVDELQVGYSDNVPPIVFAGANKSCMDHDTFAPFSDCDFYDTDGTVDHARYKVDGEVDVWTEIPQGGYGTLLEAVRAFTYVFDEVGDITVRLQVEDDDEQTSDDSLTVTVSKHTVTFNVTDLDSGLHLLQISFFPGDGSDVQVLDSPFTWDYDWSISDRLVDLQKEGYIGVYGWPVQTSEHTENVTMVQCVLFETHASARWDWSNLKLIVNLWLTRQGRIMTSGLNGTEVNIEVFAGDGGVTTLDTKDTSTFNSRGFAELEFSSAELGGDLSTNELYVVTGHITYQGVEYALGSPFTVCPGATLANQNSILSLVQKIDKIESGRWKITANTMVFYDSDGETPLLVFDLLDKDGLPTETEAFERVPK